jgi:hypothetical protein
MVVSQLGCDIIPNKCYCIGAVHAFPCPFKKKKKDHFSHINAQIREEIDMDNRSHRDYYSPFFPHKAGERNRVVG